MAVVKMTLERMTMSCFVIAGSEGFRTLNPKP